jgi:hypothetical protein
MKQGRWIIILLLALITAMAACGGGGTAPEATVDEGPPAAEEATPAEEEAAPAGDAPAEEPAAEAPPAEEPVAAEAIEGDVDIIAGRPASGIDPDTGLEINPPSVVPGVDFIVRGELINANLTPQESPEFMVLAPSGTRYRIRPQAVNEIFYDDGTQPALHEFQRGVLAQATVRQEEDAGATITVTSSDFTLLHGE